MRILVIGTVGLVGVLPDVVVLCAGGNVGATVVVGAVVATADVGVDAAGVEGVLPQAASIIRSRVVKRKKGNNVPPVGFLSHCPPACCILFKSFISLLHLSLIFRKTFRGK